MLGYENEISRSMQADCKGKQVWFTRLHDTDNGAFLRKEDGMLCMAEDGVVTPFLAQKDVKLRGLHNIENLLAAAAAVWGEVPVEAIRQVGSTFTGVEHRIEPVRTLDGVLYYNDSIGTSPTRTIAGLRSFDRKVILIAGGYDKHIPYEPLAPEIIAHVKNLVLMGATGPRIEQAVRECPGFDEAALPIQHADNMQHAVELARAAAKPGDIIILSPASASFDLYPNFEVRGREFKRSSTRSSDCTGKGCKAPYPVRECLPGFCRCWTLCCRWIVRSFAKVSRGGSTRALRWRWNFPAARHGWPGTQTPQNWQAFCPSAGARAPFWTGLSARRRTAGTRRKH